MAINKANRLFQATRWPHLLPVSVCNDDIGLALTQPVIVAAGVNTTIAMNASQTWVSSNLVALAQAAGSKSLNLSFNGNQTLLSLIQPVVAAAGINTGISMNTAETWVTSDLTALEQAAGNKRLGLDFTATFATLAVMQLVVAAAGANTSISMGVAQAWPSPNLVTLAQAGTSKNLSFTSTGNQTPWTLLTPVVAASGATTTVSVTTAQVYPVNDLVRLVQSVG